MPTAVDYILEGLAKYLELERELGNRVVEIDRRLLEVEDAPSIKQSNNPTIKQSSSHPPVQAPSPSIKQSNNQTTRQSPNRQVLDFVFLHHAPLKPLGVEMMAKIVTAMKKTPETAPVVFTGERPTAKIYIVLGSSALKQWFPGRRGAPGSWIKGDAGEEVLVTYSPEYIYRFGATPTPALQKLKKEMWTSLKGVMQRVG